MRKRVEKASVVIILVTFILFFVALFLKGFTHDMLLEAGVFLVSVKLILNSYKTGIVEAEIQRKLDQIMDTINK